METSTIIYVLEIIGTAAFAVSGSVVTLKKQSDIFGMIFLGVTTAVGGGVLRDVMIGNIPPIAFTNPVFLIIAASVSALVFVLAYHWKENFLTKVKLIDKINNVFDAAGLGVFTVTGMKTAVDMGYGDNALLVVFVGMITGIGGGIIRDTMIGEIPFVLKKKIYALASLCGGVFYYISLISNLNENLGIFIGISVIFSIRMCATKFKWELPKIDIRN